MQTSWNSKPALQAVTSWCSTESKMRSPIIDQEAWQKFIWQISSLFFLFFQFHLNMAIIKLVLSSTFPYSNSNNSSPYPWDTFCGPHWKVNCGLTVSLQRYTKCYMIILKCKWSIHSPSKYLLNTCKVLHTVLNRLFYGWTKPKEISGASMLPKCCGHKDFVCRVWDGLIWPSYLRRICRKLPNTENGRVL